MVKRILYITLILLFVGLPGNVKAQTNMTKEDVIRTVRDNFVARKPEFTINMSTKTLKELGTNMDLLKAAVAMDDESTSKDGDYLDVSVSSWGETWTYNNLGKASIIVTAKYRTTLKQEQLLDDKLEIILKSLKLENATDYEKVKAIHDYIINRASYDQTYKKYTAYNALIYKSAVCQGYAAAAYRLLSDAGIESRIISGTAGGGSHIWNIVKVDGKWYNLDLTWDDPIMSDGKQVISYDYFLKNDKVFSDHARAAAYRTEEFLAAYPIAAKSYKMSK
jgi:transglutaminase/protease-like cytokinesis protein 3